MLEQKVFTIRVTIFNRWLLSRFRTQVRYLGSKMSERHAPCVAVSCSSRAPSRRRRCRILSRLGQARTRRCGKIPAPFRGRFRCFHTRLSGRHHCPRARRRRSCCCRRLVGSRSPRRRRRRTGRGPGAAVAAWQHCLVGRAPNWPPMAARIGHDWRSSGDQGFYGIGGRWRRSCRSGMLLPEISAMAAANRGRHMRGSADTI